MRRQTVGITPEVRDVLARMTWRGNVATMPQLDRKLYEAVNKVLELAGGKWHRGMKGHVFSEDGEDRIAQALELGEILDVKKTFQFFPTPAPIANMMASRLGIEENDFVLEPSAGDGALIKAVALGHSTRYITAVELNLDLAKQCYRNTGIAPNPEDFMTWEPPFKFNRIIMNPPFTDGQDVDHVTRAFSMLEPDGRLVAITAPSWQFRTNRKFEDFRKLVDDHGHYEDIPAGAFAESGTDIRTVLVVLEGGRS